MVSIFKQKAFIVFNHAVSKARKSTDAIKVIPRLYKALGIIQHHDYYQAEKAKYQPTYYSCGCDDWKYHMSVKRGYTGHCKHMIAEILIERINQLQYKQLDFFNMIGS